MSQHVFCSRLADSPRQALERHNAAEEAFEAMREALQEELTEWHLRPSNIRLEPPRIQFARAALALADKVSKP